MIFLNIDIKNKKENIMFSRIEIEAAMTFEKSATPSGEQVAQKLSAVLEVDKKLVVIKNITTKYGETAAKVTAYQYLSEEELLNHEPKIAKIRADEEKKAAEEAKKKADEEAAKKAEEKKEEPKEKKKEEPAEKKEEAKAEKKEEPKAEKKEEAKAEKKEEPAEKKEDKKE